jgi:phytanoyl-CoA hydroxylase
MLTPAQKQHFDREGYLIYRQLFSQEEIDQLSAHFMELRQQGRHPGDFSGIDVNSSDPLKKFPRMIHMHRWDPLSLQWLLDPRIAQALTDLLDMEPFAVQTMLYFKPPRARGQALHQDQYYLRVQPGSCIAAWLALDLCDEESGCLKVVPGSQNWPLLCTVKADTTQSFTDVTVPIPPGTDVRSMLMEPGDMLFFNGQLVHGSGPNHSSERFRRSLIGHYIAGDARQVAQYYHPALRMNGEVVGLGVSEGGGSCGIWVEQDGEPVIELAGIEGLSGRTE